ncbi:hypothetical protein B0H67DRAFT_369222 [Lasiosphaeris hirsuta]|uniref:Uncharacterized protein n=1 Tax=Lasiosphaeris hirsuta TaxID=260670 RepID=A0AA40DM99_9PEZI|nr:hypothetical protein B0H67DRAFT_369222 [Lasiosphaeris hirsuta]
MAVCDPLGRASFIQGGQWLAEHTVQGKPCVGGHGSSNGGLLCIRLFTGEGACVNYKRHCSRRAKVVVGLSSLLSSAYRDGCYKVAPFFSAATVLSPSTDEPGIAAEGPPRPSRRFRVLGFSFCNRLREHYHAAKTEKTCAPSEIDVVPLGSGRSSSQERSPTPFTSHPSAGKKLRREGSRLNPARAYCPMLLCDLGALRRCKAQRMADSSTLFVDCQ